jgi:hypothetical protein
MNRLSLRAAVNAMCKHCLYDPGSGNGGWLEQVQACSSGNCPLHPVRPLPVKAGKSGKDTRTHALRPDAAIEGQDALYGRIVGHNDVMTTQGRAA